MLDASAVRQALFVALTADRAVADLVDRRVFHLVAPETLNGVPVTFPLVIFHRQAGTPTDAFGKRAFLRQTWLVKAVDADAGSSTRAEQIQAAAIGALERNLATVSGGSIHDVRYLSDVDYIETDSGRQYRHHGALMRVVLSEA